MKSKHSGLEPSSSVPCPGTIHTPLVFTALTGKVGKDVEAGVVQVSSCWSEFTCCANGDQKGGLDLSYERLVLSPGADGPEAGH